MIWFILTMVNFLLTFFWAVLYWATWYKENLKRSLAFIHAYITITLCVTWMITEIAG